MRAILDLCPVDANTAQNICCFLNSHLEEVLGLGLVRELVHLKDADSYLKAERNPPSLLHCTVVPLHQCLFICDLCLLHFPSIRFPALCERLDMQCFSRTGGALEQLHYVI